MSETVERKSSDWKGPVLAALVLVGGYVGYQVWYEHHSQDQQCAILKRTFSANMESMTGPANDAIEASKRAGNQLPMASLSDSVAANKEVMTRLNAECPDWMSKNY